MEVDRATRTGVATIETSPYVISVLLLTVRLHHVAIYYDAETDAAMLKDDLIRENRQRTRQ